TAANAEESASASEELQAQAQAMKELVGELVALVQGAKKAQGAKNIQAEQAKELPQGPSYKDLSSSPRRADKGNGSPRLSRKPQEVFPLDEEEANFARF
ncbi:MAG: hypothetical protein WHX93_18380, partial [bacterium]